MCATLLLAALCSRMRSPGLPDTPVSGRYYDEVCPEKFQPLLM